MKAAITQCEELNKAWKCPGRTFPLYVRSPNWIGHYMMFNWLAPDHPIFPLVLQMPTDAQIRKLNYEEEDRLNIPGPAFYAETMALHEQRCVVATTPAWLYVVC